VNRRVRALLPVLLVGGTILALAAACSGSAPAATTKPGPLVASVAHKAGAAHALQPKRLEAVAEVDMYELYFANPQGQKNPTIKLPAGKTVGIHIHNEGTLMHEIAIGRTVKKGGDYEQTLTELVESDVFFYYGEAKAELGGAKYGEVEVEPGVKDIWIRMTVPAELKGEWEIGCFVEGHYEGGMRATIVFE